MTDVPVEVTLAVNHPLPIPHFLGGLSWSKPWAGAHAAYCASFQKLSALSFALQTAVWSAEETQEQPCLRYGIAYSRIGRTGEDPWSL
jgi:hypothetical protein